MQQQTSARCFFGQRLVHLKLTHIKLGRYQDVLQHASGMCVCVCVCVLHIYIYIRIIICMHHASRALSVFLCIVHYEMVEEWGGHAGVA